MEFRCRLGTAGGEVIEGIYVADTEAKAQEEAKHFLWRMGETVRGPREFFAPAGYRSRAAARMACCTESNSPS